MTRNLLGTFGLAIFIPLFVVASIISYIAGPQMLPAVSSILGFTPPLKWIEPHFLSWLINLLLLGGAALYITLLNKGFNFIRSTDTVLPMTFLLFVGSMPWLTQQFNSSTLMLAVNLACIPIIFSTYKSENATQQVFTIATLISVGSFFQYGFFMLIPAYLIGMGMMCIFCIKELLALLMGLVAPYWCVGAYLLLSYGDFDSLFQSLQLPHFSGLFNNFKDKTDLLVMFINLGFTTLIGLVLAMNNTMRLFAGNKQLLAMNNVILFLGLMCGIGMIADYHNQMTYAATFYFCVATQVASACALGLIHRTRVVMIILGIIYTCFYCFI